MCLSSLTAPCPQGGSLPLPGDLLTALRTVRDPRRHGGRRHRVEYVLVAAFTRAGLRLVRAPPRVWWRV